MSANEPSLSGPIADELTPLEISKAMLESEEDPNTARPLTPLGQAASGLAPRRTRSSWALALRSPATAWCAIAGVGLIAALVYVAREPRRSRRAG